MTREERELSIEYLEKIKEDYIEGNAYERHTLPEYYAIENAIKALECMKKIKTLLAMDNEQHTRSIRLSELKEVCGL